MTPEIHTDQLEQELKIAGKALVCQFLVLIKTAHNYPEGHAALDSPVASLLESIQGIHHHNEEASISFRSGYLFLGEIRLKPDAGGYDAFLFTMNMMKQYGMCSVHFSSDVTNTDILNFAYALREIDPASTSEAFAALQMKLRQRLVNTILVEAIAQEKEAPEEKPLDHKQRAMAIYFQTMQAISEVMEQAKLGQTLRLRKTKRIIQGMIDLLLTAEANLIGLTTIRCHDEYTYNHSVNVCILSLAIGHQARLSKQELCDLGMAALFHDIGKADIPLEILNKPTKFTDDDWAVIKKHPVMGVNKLMQLKGLDTLNSKIICGTFEHHMNYDFSGYPAVPAHPLSLFGRIINIADCYDAMTSSRVYRRTPLPPDKVLRYMLAQGGTTHDPVLIKLLVNCVGIYPVGSLLLLSSGELAIVISTNPDPDNWAKPCIRLIADAQGNECAGDLVYLSATGTDRDIAAVIDANHYGIDVSQYFV